jgi:hypothetical protein
MILLAATSVAELYLGRNVLIPLALAILLSFALGPPVTWLYRRGLPRVPAVPAVLVLVTLLLAGFAGLVASQLTHLAQQLPTCEANLRLKTQELASVAPGSGVINRTADFMREFSREIDRITAGPEAPAAEGAPKQGAAVEEEAPRRIPVEVYEPPYPLWRRFRFTSAPWFSPSRRPASSSCSSSSYCCSVRIYAIG